KSLFQRRKVLVRLREGLVIFFGRLATLAERLLEALQALTQLTRGFEKGRMVGDQRCDLALLLFAGGRGACGALIGGRLLLLEIAQPVLEPLALAGALALLGRQPGAGRFRRVALVQQLLDAGRDLVARLHGLALLAFDPPDLPGKLAQLSFATQHAALADG